MSNKYFYKKYEINGDLFEIKRESNCDWFNVFKNGEFIFKSIFIENSKSAVLDFL